MTPTMTPPWGTPNSGTNPRAFCAHCQNQSLVALDGTGPPADWPKDEVWICPNPEYGAPCPHCHCGQTYDAVNYGGRYWLDVRSLAVETWHGGLSVHDTHRCRFAEDGSQYPCGYPCRPPSTMCVHHDAAVAQLRAAAGG